MKLPSSLALVVLAGCASTGSAPVMEDGSVADAAAPSLADAPSLPPAQGATDVLVYTHSATELFALDPNTLTVRRIGTFMRDGGAIEMTDIAVNREGVMYGCSQLLLFRIDPTNASATLINVLFLGFSGLSFVPNIDGSETLVGATQRGEYYAVDLSSGLVSPLGAYSAEQLPIGDLVSVEGLGTYATVAEPTGDQLIRVDFASRTAEPIGAGIGFSNVWGLGFFRSALYGFTSNGQVLQIDVRTGVGALVETSTGASSFSGAGVTTVALVDLI